MAKVKELSVNAKGALAYLKETGKPMTLKEMKETLEGLNPAHLTALVNRGLVTAEKVEVEEVVVVKRKVNLYTLVETDEVAETE